MLVQTGDKYYQNYIHIIVTWLVLSLQIIALLLKLCLVKCERLLYATLFSAWFLSMSVTDWELNSSL